MRTTTTAWAMALGLSALAVCGSGRVQAAAAEDDLAVVKRAVASPAPAAVPVQAVAPAAEAHPARKASEMRWLRVRVVGKKDSHERVSINLPLTLARSVAGDVHLRQDCKDPHDRSCALTLNEILALLEPGQDVVSIDDATSTVRVWVE